MNPLEFHKKYRGKIEVRSKVPLRSKKDLSLAYTPGVGAVSSYVAKNSKSAYDYTTKSNSVAVVSDGTAVLGLGNIGPYGALPVMEGKAILFKKFGCIDAYPICLDTKSSEEIIKTVKYISPVFGGINLEDISAPRCFDIEERLKKELDIPVMHDDQHGTAIVILAGLINAAKIVGKRLEDLEVVISGAGAAGFAVTKILHCLHISKDICTPVKELYVCDRKGLIHKGRGGLNKYKNIIARTTNHKGKGGSLADALEGADVFIGVSAPNLVTKEMIRRMNDNPIVFALANPVPEISPEEAKKGGAKVIATGRSDYPNQINNVLAFPGVFRGALDANATQINHFMKIEAAHAIASLAKKGKIIPEPFDLRTPASVAEAVALAAVESNVAEKKIGKDYYKRTLARIKKSFY